MIIEGADKGSYCSCYINETSKYCNFHNELDGRYQARDYNDRWAYFIRPKQQDCHFSIDQFPKEAYDDYWMWHDNDF